MRIAVQLHPQHASYDDIRNAAVRAEEAGVDVIYNWDHFYPLYGEADGAHFECWTMLASWAEVTERVKIGPLVTCNSYRNPELLADMARTVDHISGGRVVFGIGSGWFERDYEEYGYEFGTAGGRLRALGEALPRIEERFSKLNPQPVGPMPIMIGGGGEKVTLRLVAKHADIWHYFWNSDEPERFTNKISVLDEHCAAVGRDRNEIEISAGIDPSHIGQADAMAAAGVVEVTLGLNGPDYDMGAVAEWVSWAAQL